MTVVEAAQLALDAADRAGMVCTGVHMSLEDNKQVWHATMVSKDFEASATVTL